MASMNLERGGKKSVENMSCIILLIDMYRFFFYIFSVCVRAFAWFTDTHGWIDEKLVPPQMNFNRTAGIVGYIRVFIKNL